MKKASNSITRPTAGPTSSIISKMTVAFPRSVASQISATTHGTFDGDTLAKVPVRKLPTRDRKRRKLRARERPVGA